MRVTFYESFSTLYFKSYIRCNVLHAIKLLSVKLSFKIRTSLVMLLF